MLRNNVLSWLQFSLILIGCTRAAPIQKIVSIDPTFQDYVNQFVAEGRGVGKMIIVDNLYIHFTNSLEPSTLGVCYLDEELPAILINVSDWIDESDAKRRVILFHELGHCLLGREHVKTWNGIIVTSIMYPYIMNDSMYLNNWSYYMKELFYGH